MQGRSAGWRRGARLQGWPIPPSLSNRQSSLSELEVYLSTELNLCPDGRAERKEIARWAILARSQAAGVANSAIPLNRQSSLSELEVNVSTEYY